MQNIYKESPSKQNTYRRQTQGFNAFCLATMSVSGSVPTSAQVSDGNVGGAVMYTPILVLLGLIVFAFLYLTALSDGEFAVYVWHLLHPDLRKEKEERQRKEEQAWERRLQEKEQEEILSRLRRSVWETFAVDLSVIHQAETQNEIVRVLDLLAYQVAIACVNEDKATRGEKIEPYRDTSIYATEHSWSEMVPKLKREWAGKRSFALQICPELKDRLPHFSEFEPLKSYREEHIHQKAEEKKARKIQL